jgi:putative transcriptional regulator
VLRLDKVAARRTPPNTIVAATALAVRGMSLLRAKRAMDRLLESGEVVVHVPVVDDLARLVSDLTDAGLIVTRLASGDVDVRLLRARLQLSQEQFALRYNLDVDAVRNWEQGRRRPDRAVAGYLRAIDRDPEGTARAQEIAV